MDIKEGDFLTFPSGICNKKGSALMTLPLSSSNLILIHFLNFLLGYSEWNRSKNSNGFFIYSHLNAEDSFGIEVFTKNIFSPLNNRPLGYSCRVLSPFG